MASSEVREVFSRLKVKVLLRDWVEAAWRDDFTPPPELPSEYELQLDQDLRELLCNARSALRAWIESIDDDFSSEYSRSRVSDSEDEELISNSSFASRGRSWRTLGPLINRRATVALLSAVIGSANQDNATEEDRDRAAAAARLYLAMLGIAGASAFGVFSVTMFELSLAPLLLAAQLAVETVPRSKGRKKPHQSDPSNVNILTANERRALVTRLTGLLDDLGAALATLPLRGHPTAASAAAAALMTAYRAPQLSVHAAELLEKLCGPNHGDAARDVARLALPVIGVDPGLLELVGRLAKEPNACRRMEALVQQILLGAPDRADARARAAATAVDLATRLPPSTRENFVLWVAVLCHTDTVRHRLTGLDGAVRLLSVSNFLSPSASTSGHDITVSSLEIDENNQNNSSPSVSGIRSTPDGSEHYSVLSQGADSPSSLMKSVSGSRSSHQDRRTTGSSTAFGSTLPSFNCSRASSCRFSLSITTAQSFLFTSLLSRCQDISPRVRAKALSLVAPLILSRDSSISNIIHRIFLTSGPRKEIFDVQQFFREQRHKKGFHNLDPLPSADSVLDLLRIGADDDKVFVRKNSLQVLANIMRLDQRYITHQNLNLLVDSCRDLSVSVRKMLMQCMTDLILAYPAHELMPTAWVSGVVPLFSDNEVKAQEKVLELGEQVILSNLVHANKCMTDLHRLPWQLINLITKMDMRRLFKYCCQHWSNQKKITKHVFAVIKSYIGGENTRAAWYFLSSLSEFQDMPNADFLLEYFNEKILCTNQVDELCAKLVLRCIILNWSALSVQSRTEFGECLRKALDQISIPLALISPAVDVVQKSNKEAFQPWATSLIQVCEGIMKKICNSGFSENNSLKNDVTLSRVIFLLGDLAQFAPDIVSQSSIILLSDLIDITGWEKERLQVDAGQIHAVAVVTLGKLCLQNHITAKSTVPLLGALVAAPTPSPVKINSCIALSDLCVRFSALVEPYFGDMCVCLKDRDPDVRRNTLTLITRLVQEEFIKLKVPVFIYLLTMMRDSELEIRDFASSFIVNSMLRKNQYIMSQHFIPVIMFLNDFKIYESVSPQEKENFCLCGEDNTLIRREMYAFMLTHMLDDMKFRTKYRICVEVFDPISEGTITLDETATSILKDSLFVMGCEEIRMCGRGRGTAADEDDEDLQTVQAAKTVVYNQLFENLVRQNLTDNVVPAIIKLKRKLMSLKSPLVKDLMICLRDILKDFKEQVEEILADDPELAAEVAHDLREMENGDRSVNNSPEGINSPPDQDTLMIEMTRVAKRISIGVMEHGASIITAGNDETPQLRRNSGGSRRSSTTVGRVSSPIRRRPSETQASSTGRKIKPRRKKGGRRNEADSDSDSTLASIRGRGPTPTGSSPPTSVSSLSSYSSSASRKS